MFGKSEIEAAFGERQKPAIITDSHQLTRGEKAAVMQLASMANEEVPIDFWRKSIDLISFLNPESFAYYMPSIMLSVSSDIANGEYSFCFISLLNIFNRHPAPLQCWDDYSRKRVSLFSIAELGAIERWLWSLLETQRLTEADSDAVCRSIDVINTIIKEKQGNEKAQCV